MRDEEFLLCIPTSWVGRPAVASERASCTDCDKPIWRAASSPTDIPALCIPCVNDRLSSGENLELGQVTHEQLLDLEAYYQRGNQ